MDLFSTTTLIRIPAILIALTIHELSHGAIAGMLGDSTAKDQGRISLNPLSHLDPFGTLMLLFGPFGWAKPVPVNPVNFKDPQKGMALVAAAGPLSNIILAALAGQFFRFGLVDPNSLFTLFLYIFFMINVGLAVFNLLPVYPLDGSRILVAFLNEKQLAVYYKSMRIIPILFIIMIIAESYFHVPLLSKIFIPALDLAQRILIGT